MYKEKLNIASVSWGKDSMAMLIVLISMPQLYKLDHVVSVKTGMEFDSVYRTRDAFLPLLEERGIPYTEIDISDQFADYLLSKVIISRETGQYKRSGYGWCGGACRWGTRLKINALQKFYHSFPKSRYDITEYVGIASDELDRLDRAICSEGIGKKCYPLVEQEVTEADALAMCYENGFTWPEITSSGDSIPLYDVVSRGSCWCCRNKNLSELKNMLYLLPDYFDRLTVLEEQIGEPMKGPGKSLPELERRFCREGLQLSLF